VCGLSAALVIKGAFVTLTLLGAGTWALVNPTRTPGSIVRPIVAGIVSVGALAAVAFGYDAWYRAITGEPYWSVYWQVQLSHVEVSTPVSGAVTFLQHVGFYIVRLLWHPAPWSLALLVVGWQRRETLITWLGRTDPQSRGLIFALLYAALLTLALSTSSRVAERYVFNGTYAIATAGAVVAYRSWPRLRQLIDRLDARVPALPAVVWLVLVMARLGLGHVIPRV
jgi:hypothetical protein